jgi:hypothetical protein
MLSFFNYVDRASISISASPAALGSLPTSNLKTPWFDGIARGASSSYTFTLEWQQRPAITNDPGDVTDLVALLGVNWRSQFSADLRWWNTGGSWSSPAGQTTQLFYYSATQAPWIGRIPRNIFLPLTSQVSAQFWRMDVTLGYSADGAAWAWEARRLWSGPALRLSMRLPQPSRYQSTREAVLNETAIPSVTDGRTYRRVPFAGRALPQVSVYGPTLTGVDSLHQFLYERGPESEMIYLPRLTSASPFANQVQLMSLYGRLVGELEVTLLKGSRFDLAGVIQEAPSPLPWPLGPPA